MAERRLEGLQRVLGVYPLASSAYGNVGSSIYYALGLVAALALAKVQVGRRLSGHWEKVGADQTGRRIIDEAKAMHAAAIVMPMSQDGPALGGRSRPCSASGPAA